MRRVRLGVVSLACTLLVAACGVIGSDDGVPVTLEPSTVTWETYQYELTRFNTILAGSYDGETRTEHTFDTWILENEFLRVTLLPEFGGRILSMVYKPTGHEQLYQNPIGVPYQIDTNVFFFNWLMVYGGIFPTFPEPEHGKTWFLPWDFEIIEETDDVVTVAMSFVDDVDYPLAPGQYSGDATGLEVTFLITLRAGRAALDTAVVVENPGGEPVAYEYWTNATLSPGSDPDDPRSPARSEIIAPVDMIKIPSFWSNIAAQERPTGLIEVYDFDTLREFGNWADLGIAYAFPDVSSANYWGVINHDNGEGIFRIADNSVTPGLKIWTWGYSQTADLDPEAGPQEARPYIELWAGVTREFFQSAELAANAELEIAEVYSPSVGLTGVTHANEDFLVNMVVDDGGDVRFEIFGLHPGTEVSAIVSAGGDVIRESELTLDAVAGNVVSASLPPMGDPVTLVLRDASGDVVFSGDLVRTDA